MALNSYLKLNNTVKYVIYTFGKIGQIGAIERVVCF